jgi:hypothetical protein
MLRNISTAVAGVIARLAGGKGSLPPLSEALCEPSLLKASRELSLPIVFWKLCESLPGSLSEICLGPL